MDARNLDPRDLVNLGIDLEQHPAVVQPEVSRSTAAPDPELPTTVEQLRNIVRLECLKALPTPDEFRGMVRDAIKTVLSQVPTGEA